MKTLKFTSLFACLFFFLTLNAQLSHPHFISVNFGTNIPLSDFKDSDSLTSTSANNGIYYSFEAGAFFSKVVGIGVNIGAFSNSINDNSIKEQLRTDFTNSDGQFSVSSENWTNGYIMLGPYLSLGKKKKFIVDAKLLAGVINSDKPFINIEAEDGSGTEVEIEDVTSTSFGFNYGLHFRIQLKSKLALRINAEQLISTQEFVNKVRTLDIMGNEVNTRTTAEQQISALNLGLGIVINL